MATAKCKKCEKLISDKSIYIEQDVNKRDGTIDKKKLYFCCDECRVEYETELNKPKEVVETDYTRLTDFIQNYYTQQGWSKRSIPFPMMMSQLKNMMNDHKNYNYSAILYVLNYMSNILQLNLLTEESNNSILSLVPYYYEEARSFCIKCAEIKKLAKEFDFSNNVKIVKVGNREKKIEEMEF